MVVTARDRGVAQIATSSGCYPLHVISLFSSGNHNATQFWTLILHMPWEPGQGRERAYRKSIQDVRFQTTMRGQSDHPHIQLDGYMIQNMGNRAL